MKRKRTTTNSLKSYSCSSSQQSLPETKLSAAAAVEEEALHLPDDCWESICTFLVDGDGDDDNHHYIEPLSLASKHLLSITNRHRSSFIISDRTLPFIPTLFHRFPNLTSLHITSFKGDLNDLLCQISKFPFKLKSLKLPDFFTFPATGLLALSRKITTLTSLTCSKIAYICNTQCVLISDCFPLLEELHLRYNPVRKSSHESIQIGVEAMLTALPKLRKINFSGTGFCKINGDSLLLHLCKNCEFLEEVVMLSCKFLTPDGFASAIRQRPTLKSLSFIRWLYKKQDDIISDSLVSLKGLTCLDLSRQEISDKLLSSIAMGDLPLRRLVLQNCVGYSYAGIFSLLSKCQHIQHLNLQCAGFLNDQHIVKLSKFLADLLSINLSQCQKLTDSTLFALVRNCPSLSNIKLMQTRIGKNIAENSNSSMNFVLNTELKSLYLACSSLLKDESLVMFASIFPNLQLLDLSNCNDISEEGICEVLRRCRKIRNLNLFRCNAVNKLHMLNFEVPKLEVLNLTCTSVDDVTLYAISMNCRGLLKLLLVLCNNVTKNGVKHVVENCTQLREINLTYCFRVRADIVDYMVDSRPSLRKIFVPPDYCLSNKKRKLFRNRGLLIRE